jgi:aryl-alcohol dehydrogenase-like predicted oxidoreductase
MFTRDRVEQEYLPLYEQYGYGLTIWSPLASGILSGKYNDFKVPEDSRLALKDDQFMVAFNKKLSTPEGRAEIEKVRKAGEIAKTLGCTTSQLAIAWCLKNKRVSSVITGYVHCQHTRKLTVLTLTSPAERAKLRRLPKTSRPCRWSTRSRRSK